MSNWLPTIYTKPLSEDFPSDGDKLAELVRHAWKTPDNPDGIELDDWQKWLLHAVLERYPEGHERAGKLRFRQVVISVGRQNGKSLVSACLSVWGMLMHYPTGSNIISLASSLDQARIIYDRVLHVVQGNPYLAKRFKKASETRGIVTADGSGRYNVKPAKESALQGIPMTLCLFDELHLANKGMWTAAEKGTMSFGEAMIIGITTAGDESSEQLKTLYEIGKQAAEGDPSLEHFGFFLWEAPKSLAVDDPEAIKAANPAVACGRIPVERVLTSYKQTLESEWRRYTLNQFVLGSEESWIPGEIFRKAGTRANPDQFGGVFAVDITEKNQHATIAYANDAGEEIHTELVQTYVNPSENQLLTRLTQLYNQYRPRAIVLDGSSMPGLAKKLKMSGLPVWQLWVKEIAAATATSYQLFATGKGKHNNDPLVIAQSPKAIGTYSGDKWFISKAKSLGDIDAVRATIFALYVATQAEKSGIGVF